MKLAILGAGGSASGYSTKRLMEEARKEFKEVVQIPALNVKLKIDKELDAVHENRSLKDFDYILPRIDSKRAQIGYPIVRALDVFGVKKPYMSETILIAHNKFLTLEKLVTNGIRVPRTYLTGSKNSACEILKKEKLPIILKVLSGFGGQGVMFIESKDAAESTIETLRTLKQEIFIEEFLPNAGEDVRGIVAGDEIIASYKRIAAPGETRANIHAGGRGSVYKLNEEMQDIVFRTAKAVGSKICAVDILVKKDVPYVIEVNINPGLEGIEKTTGINIAQRIISFVKDEVKK